MGSALSMFLPCLPVVPRARLFRSQRRQEQFSHYSWPSPTWQCTFCRARWTVHDTVQTMEDNEEVNGPLQIAVHEGQQLEQWAHGDAGSCLQCQVWWEEI